MKTPSNTPVLAEARDTITAVIVHTRSKIISAADVWNIQRNKRTVVQRRFCL
jgi:hypothetical protein